MFSHPNYVKYILGAFRSLRPCYYPGAHPNAEAVARIINTKRFEFINTFTGIDKLNEIRAAILQVIELAHKTGDDELEKRGYFLDREVMHDYGEEVKLRKQ